MIMANKYEINDYEDIAMIEHEDIRYKNIQKEEEA